MINGGENQRGNQEWTTRTHWYTKHRTKTNKVTNTTQRTKKMSNTYHIIKPGMNPGAPEGIQNEVKQSIKGHHNTTHIFTEYGI